MLFAPGAESGQTSYFYSIAHFPGQINTAPGGNAEINLHRLLAPAPSQALPRQLPHRGSQGLRLIAKVLGITRKFPAVLLPLPLGEVDLRSKDGEGEGANVCKCRFLLCDKRKAFRALFWIVYEYCIESTGKIC